MENLNLIDYDLWNIIFRMGKVDKYKIKQLCNKLGYKYGNN